MVLNASKRCNQFTIDVTQSSTSRLQVKKQTSGTRESLDITVTIASPIPAQHRKELTLAACPAKK
jgi:hypothetical protein